MGDHPNNDHIINSRSSSSSRAEGSMLVLVEPAHGGSAPAPFLTKTYQLVEDPATNHIVSWGHDHTTFVVWRPSEFSRDLLPAYFKHNNFSSFVRQLNTYGFRKIITERWEFGNEFFRKGEKQLLCEIHRRKSMNRSLSPPATSEEAQQISSPCRSVEANSGALNAYGEAAISSVILSDENQRLRRNNSLLQSELIHMRRLYSDIVSLVQHHLRIPPPPPPPPPVPTPSATCGTRNVNAEAAALASAMGKAKEESTSMDGAGEEEQGKSSFKLFGVPVLLHVHGRKRLRPSGDQAALPSSKCFKTGLTLHPGPPSVEDPW